MGKSYCSYNIEYTVKYISMELRYSNSVKLKHKIAVGNFKTIFCKYYNIGVAPFLLLPVSQTSPERGGQKLDERTGPDEQTTLAGIHAHLLEVDAHQRKQGPKRRVKEEVERLDCQELLVYGPEYQFDQV